MQLITELNKILAEHAATRVNGRVASQRTATASGEVLRPIFTELYEIGYRLEDPRNIAEKHIKALCKEWYARELAPKTIQGYLSQLRIFCRWVGKNGLVRDVYYYLPNVPKEKLRVKAVAETSKSWAENGVDVLEKAREAASLDRRFHLMILLQVAFGLRRLEVLQMKPWKVDKGDKFAVYESKGGRPRDIYITTPVQRAILDHVKSQVKRNEHMGWVERIDGKPFKGEWLAASLMYSENRYEHLMRKLGISKATTKCTGHGLRAQYAENAALLIDLIPATLGGTGGQMEKDDMDVKRLQVSESLGHSRVSVTGAYYGSFGRRGELDAPGRAKEAIVAGMQQIKVDPDATIPESCREQCMVLAIELQGIGVYDDPRKVHALWTHHSRRHATDWLKPSEGTNLAALEAAAISIMKVAAVRRPV